MHRACVVGVTSYTPVDNPKKVYSLPCEYIDALKAAGGQPVLLVGGDAADALARIDGLVLSGGGDIDPARYGAPAHARNYMVDPERDGFELALASAAVERGLPLFAICRGMQVVNVALGGSLIAHLPDSVGDAVAHRLPPREPVAHEVTVHPGSCLEAIVGQGPLEVVSWHHQGVDRLGGGLVPVASSADGVVEAVELQDARGWFLGVQWHPELNAASSPRQAALFEAFVRAACGQREGSS